MLYIYIYIAWMGWFVCFVLNANDHEKVLSPSVFNTTVKQSRHF